MKTSTTSLSDDKVVELRNHSGKVEFEFPPRARTDEEVNELDKVEQFWEELRANKTCSGRCAYYSLYVWNLYVAFMAPFIQRVILVLATLITFFSLFERMDGDIIQAFRTSIAIMLVVCCIFQLFSYCRYRSGSVIDQRFTQSRILIVASGNLSPFDLFEFILETIILIALIIVTVTIQEDCMKDDRLCQYLMMYLKGYNGN